MVLSAAGYLTHRPIHHEAGMLVPDVPQQGPVPAGFTDFEHNGYRLEPQASFALEARVLARKRYRWDAGAPLSPVDLALGWGRMSDTATLDSLQIWQRRRFYHYRWRNLPPIPQQEIARSSANMHLIPESHAVMRALKRVKPGNLVKLSGFLVHAYHPSGHTWRTSLVRTDTGAGACELFWVQTIEVL